MATSIPASGSGGQDPSAVAITGGTMSGVTVQSFTPAQLTAMFNRVNSDWNTQAWATLKAGAPSVTAYKEVPVGMIPFGQTEGAITNDALVLGGGVSTAAGVATLITGAIYKNMSAGGWGFSARITIPVLSSGVAVQTGLFDLTTGHNYAVIGAIFSVSSANFWGEISNANGVVGSGTVTFSLGTYDANPHNWSMTDDGTTVTIYKDGVSVATTATRTMLPGAVDMGAGLYANATNRLALNRYGFVFAQ